MRKPVLILAIFIPLITAGALYYSGYGWLTGADRWPSGTTAKGGVACRYRTLSGIRIAYYVDICPRYSATRFPDKADGL
jgi:hypothetical protein